MNKINNYQNFKKLLKKDNKNYLNLNKFLKQVKQLIKNQKKLFLKLLHSQIDMVNQDKNLELNHHFMMNKFKVQLNNLQI